MRKLAIAFFALIPLAASAQNLAVTGKVGTLGLGAEITNRISDDWNTRIGINAYSYSRSQTESGIDYDFKLKMQTVSLIGDYFPSRDNAFRLSLGLMYDNNKVGMTAKPTGGNYVINGVTYTAAQVGSLTGEMTFNKGAPYFGIGWGNPLSKGSAWSFAADLGMLYQGKPKVRLSTSCAVAGCAANVAAEQAQAESAVSGFRWWPVVSIGASYRF